MKKTANLLRRIVDKVERYRKQLLSNFIKYLHSSEEKNFSLYLCTLTIYILDEHTNITFFIESSNSKSKTICMSESMNIPSQKSQNSKTSYLQVQKKCSMPSSKHISWPPANLYVAELQYAFLHTYFLTNKTALNLL